MNDLQRMNEILELIRQARGETVLEVARYLSMYTRVPWKVYLIGEALLNRAAELGIGEQVKMAFAESGANGTNKAASSVAANESGVWKLMPDESNQVFHSHSITPPQRWQEKPDSHGGEFE